MAGYVGTKAVLLSTTAANVGGDADIGGALTVGGAFTSQGIDDNANATAITIDSSGNVDLYQGKNLTWRYAAGSTIRGSISIDSADNVTFSNGSSNTERMRLDASGNLLVGKTALSSSIDGFQFNVGSSAWAAMTNSSANALDELLLLNRTGGDGECIQFKRGSSTVGSISAYSGDLVIGTGDTGLFFNNTSDHIKPVNSSNGANRDNAIDLGSAGSRWAVVRAGTASINTSDRNEKQDIEELSDAEQRVAVACKSLIRKFKFNDAVEAKGNDARIHVGIIAQDLQAAFASEGLDASRYAMFCSDTWWETQTEVPAVEAVAEVLDEEGNVVTEAVEAVDAYTRTDTYDTQEEAPEGATERTRLGVRYSELLAFIIGAL